MATAPFLNTPRSKPSAPRLIKKQSKSSPIRKIAERYRIGDSIVWEDTIQILAECAKELGFPTSKDLEERAKSHTLSTKFDRALVYHSRPKNVILIEDFVKIVDMYAHGQDVVAEEQDHSAWLSRSTDDGRSTLQPSFDSEISQAMHGAQWVEDKASLMNMIHEKDEALQELRNALAEKQANDKSTVSELENLVNALDAARQNQDAGSQKIRSLEDDNTHLNDELKNSSASEKQLRILLDQTTTINKAMGTQIESQTETIRNLQDEVTALREQLTERPDHQQAISGQASPLELELDLARIGGTQAVATETSSSQDPPFRPILTTHALKRQYTHTSNEGLRKHIKWYNERDVLEYVPDNLEGLPRKELYALLKRIVAQHEGNFEAPSEDAQSTGISSVTLLDSLYPSSASIHMSSPTSPVPASPSVGTNIDGAQESTATYASVATQSGINFNGYADKCLNATPYVICAAVQTDDVGPFDRITSDAPQACTIQTSSASIQDNATPGHVPAALQTDPIQTPAPIPPTAKSVPAAHDNSIQSTILSQTLAAPHYIDVQATLDENTENTTPASTTPAITVNTPSDNNTETSKDSYHSVSTVESFRLRFPIPPLGRLSTTRLLFYCPRASLRTLALRFTTAPFWLILWMIAVGATLFIVGWHLFLSRAVHDEMYGWVKLHDVRPAIEGFSESGWSVRNIIMGRWRRVWYGYWERRELARLAS